MKKIENLTKSDAVLIFLPVIVAFIVGIVVGVSSDNGGWEKVASIAVSAVFFLIFGALAGFINYLIAKTKLKKGLRIFLSIINIIMWAGIAAFCYVYLLIIIIVSALKKI